MRVLGIGEKYSNSSQTGVKAPARITAQDSRMQRQIGDTEGSKASQVTTLVKSLGLVLYRLAKPLVVRNRNPFNPH